MRAFTAILLLILALTSQVLSDRQDAADASTVLASSLLTAGIYPATKLFGVVWRCRRQSTKEECDDSHGCHWISKKQKCRANGILGLRQHYRDRAAACAQLLPGDCIFFSKQCRWNREKRKCELRRWRAFRETFKTPEMRGMSVPITTKKKVPAEYASQQPTQPLDVALTRENSVQQSTASSAFYMDVIDDSPKWRGAIPAKKKEEQFKKKEEMDLDDEHKIRFAAQQPLPDDDEIEEALSKEEEHPMHPLAAVNGSEYDDENASLADADSLSSDNLDVAMVKEPMLTVTDNYLEEEEEDASSTIAAKKFEEPLLPAGPSMLPSETEVQDDDALSGLQSWSSKSSEASIDSSSEEEPDELKYVPLDEDVVEHDVTETPEDQQSPDQSSNKKPKSVVAKNMFRPVPSMRRLTSSIFTENAIQFEPKSQDGWIFGNSFDNVRPF
jgi:hypothetical protein